MKFRLYSKSDCSLCDDAKRELDAFRRECAFELEVFDITTDPVIFEKYKYDIPVLEIDGREAAKHFLNQAKLRILVERAKQQP